MANSLTSAAKFLSQNVFQLRKKRGLSQSALAKLAGVPRSTITYLESGAGNPSLSNLLRVATAFQVTLEELLQQPRNSTQLIPAGQVPRQWRAQGSVEVLKLLPDSIPGTEIDRLLFSVGARMGGIPHTQNTKEYLICFKGKVEVIVGGDRFIVEEGDVLAFPGDQTHSYRNIGKVAADCMSVVVLALHV